MRYCEHAIIFDKERQIVIQAPVRLNGDLTELSIETDSDKLTTVTSIYLTQEQVIKTIRRLYIALAANSVEQFFNLTRGNKFMFIPDVENFFRFGSNPLPIYIKTSNGRYRLAEAGKNTGSSQMKNQFDRVLLYHGK